MIAKERRRKKKLINLSRQIFIYSIINLLLVMVAMIRVLSTFVFLHGPLPSSHPSRFLILSYHIYLSIWFRFTVHTVWLFHPLWQWHEFFILAYDICTIGAHLERSIPFRFTWSQPKSIRLSTDSSGPMLSYNYYYFSLYRAYSRRGYMYVVCVGRHTQKKWVSIVE